MASIVVIDDDDGYRAATKRALELEGHEVRTAAEGGEGLALCRQEPADLIVTDLFMPGKEGLETIQQLRREFPDVPIIAVERGAGDLLEVARHLGAKRTLAKPFDEGELTDAVRELLGDSGGSGPMARVSGFTLLRAGEDDWQPSGVEGVDVRLLYLDRTTERQTVLVRMQPGAVYPVHRHEGTEECYVIQGDLWDGDLCMETGDYVCFEPGTEHGPLSSERGCLLLVTASIHDKAA